MQRVAPVVPSLPRRLKTLAVCSSAIRASTVGFLASGVLALAVSLATGYNKFVEVLFQVVGSLLLVGLGISAAVMSATVCRHFSPGERLYPAWLLISAAAVSDTVGLFLMHVLSPQVASKPFAALLRDSGQVIGGTCRFSLLAAGLAFAVRAYRRTGLLGRLAKIDRILLGGAIVYVVVEAWDTVVEIRHGAAVTLAEVLQWPVDPLLCLLLAEALLLLRSALAMGEGRIGRVWHSFSTGVFLIVLGNTGLWAFNYGYLKWPWIAVTWYIWVPAAAAFALAPAYQLQAIYEATAAK